MTHQVDGDQPQKPDRLVSVLLEIRGGAQGALRLPVSIRMPATADYARLSHPLPEFMKDSW
jgi:hypothetical protein